MTGKGNQGAMRAQFEDLAGRWPDRPALLGPADETSTHAQLWARLQAIIATFEDSGVPAGGVIVVSLANPFDNLVVLLAASCHGIALPMPAFENDAELQRLGAEIPVDAVVVDETPGLPRHPLVASGALPLVLRSGLLNPVDGAGDRGGAGRCGARELTKPDDCLFIRTSGTLSAPKLIAISEDSLLTSARSFAAWLGLGPEDRSLCVMPQHHLHAIHRSILPFLVSGASVVVTDGPDSRQFTDWLARFSPTVMTATPTLFRQLLAATEAQGSTGHSLRVLASGSDTMPGALQTSLQDRFGIPVLQFYGLTEAAPSLTTTGRTTPAGSVGRATAPWELAFARDGVVAPELTVGEIAARGGVFNDRIVDGKRLAPDLSEGGWLLTGDLGERTPEGDLVLRGRVRDTIIKAGVKIDPVLVETAARSVAGVGDCASLGVTRSEDSAVRHVLLVSGAAGLDTVRLREDLLELLPFYAVPDDVHVVPEVPRTATSKLNRQDLARRFLAGDLKGVEAAPDGWSPEAGDPPGTPGPVADIRALFEGLLETRIVDMDGSFFDLGGDSFLALQLILEIEDRFGRRLSPNELLTHSSVAALAKLLADEGGEGNAGGEPDYRHLVCLNDEGTKAAVYLAPSSLAAPYYSRLLKEAFAEVGHPLFSFDISRVADRGQPVQTLRQLAATCVEDLRRHQPEGPYVICGFSFGAHVAFEMARQIVGSGARVAALVLLDDHADFHKPRLTLQSLQAGWHGSTIPVRSNLVLSTHVHDVFEGPIHLVRAQDCAGDYKGSPANDWDWLTRDTVTVLPVPGDHSDVLRGRVPARWARWIADLVENGASACSQDGTVRVPGRFGNPVRSVLKAREAAVAGDAVRCAALTREAFRNMDTRPAWLTSSCLAAELGTGQVFRALAGFHRHWKRSGDPAFAGIDFMTRIAAPAFQEALHSRNRVYRALVAPLLRLAKRRVGRYAVETQTRDPELLWQLSRLAQLCERPDAARLRAEQACQILPSAAMATRYAACLAQEGETDAAVAVMRQAVRAHPASTMAKRALAEHLVAAQGWSPELKTCIEGARTDDVDMIGFVFRLIELAVASGNTAAVNPILPYMGALDALPAEIRRRLEGLIAKGAQKRAETRPATAVPA